MTAAEALKFFMSGFGPAGKSQPGEMAKGVADTAAVVALRDKVGGEIQRLYYLRHKEMLRSPLSDAAIAKALADPDIRDLVKGWTARLTEARPLAERVEDVIDAANLAAPLYGPGSNPFGRPVEPVRASEPSPMAKQAYTETHPKPRSAGYGSGLSKRAS